MSAYCSVNDLKTFGYDIKDSDLENLDFINVNGSAQRLAWNSLQHYDINYNIKKTVNSQFDAFKLVRNSKNLHTFLYFFHLTIYI